MSTKSELLKQVEAAKQNMDAADDLIRQYLPFIKKEASRYAQRSVQQGVDDEVSIAMIAFHEAIRSYHQERGAFINYAALLIRSRLIDYSRKEGRHQNITSLDEPVEGEDGLTRMDQIVGSEDHSNPILLRDATRQEIEELVRVMKDYGLSLNDAAENCPKQKKTQAACFTILIVVRSQPALMEQFLKTKRLPISELVKRTKIEKKTIERHRRYLACLLLIYTNGFEIIRGHIKQVIQGGEAK